jgi:predicted dehydrogenase
VVELIQAGAIGEISRVHCFHGRSWADGKYESGHAAPASLDWNLWLGPAKERPYSPGLHPFSWRRYWDFGTGTLGDMGCHIFDLVFWALDLKHPLTVKADGPPVDQDGCPRNLACTWTFPAATMTKGLTLTWHDDTRRPPIVERLKAAHGVDLNPWGITAVFVGEKGVLAATYGQYKLFPNGKSENMPVPKKSIPDSIGHHQEWFRAIRTGSTTTCNFGYSGLVTETVLLGTVAYRSGQELAWDGPNLKVTNSPTADALLRKEYRKGWDPFV